MIPFPGMMFRKTPRFGTGAKSLECPPICFVIGATKCGDIWRFDVVYSNCTFGITHIPERCIDDVSYVTWLAS